jgi:hypothetical protein
MTSVEVVIVVLAFGIAAGIVGRAKGSSFFIWFLVGAVLPVIGLVAATLYRYEKDDPLRRCPRCGHVHRIEVQVCRYCGEDLFLPDPDEVRQPAELRRAARARDRS